MKTFYILMSNNRDTRDSVLYKTKCANKKSAQQTAEFMCDRKFSVGYVLSAQEMIKRGYDRSWAQEV